jgi:hypothetical protein
MDAPFTFRVPANIHKNPRYQRPLRELSPNADGFVVAIIIVLLFILIVALMYTLAPYLAIARPEMVRARHIVLDYPDHHPNGGLRRHLQEENINEENVGEVIDVVIDEYYGERERHDNDPQNVHEPVIVKCHSAKYKRMLELRINDAEHMAFIRGLIIEGHNRDQVRNMEIMEADREIRQHAASLPEEKRVPVLQVLDTIGHGSTTVSLTGHPVKDIWVLTLVWKRIHHPSNVKNHEEMKAVLMDQLCDASHPEGYAPEGEVASSVCINGRIGRILSVLTRLDSDEVLSEPELDLKELRNIAMFKCAGILKQRLKDEPEMAVLYVKLRDQLSKYELADVEKFEAQIRDEIDDTLRQEYQKLLSEWDLDNLVKEAQAGI